mmetsp:Transcript_4325/g.27539  ORF Transcript_4325/g.27539 Transcript_4325/m.27539 type:complete len:94 (+) Transcript_4325:304-585(+)
MNESRSARKVADETLGVRSRRPSTITSHGMPPPRKRMPDTPLKKKDLGLDGELKKRRRKNKIVVYFTSKQVSCTFENRKKNIPGIHHWLLSPE